MKERELEKSALSQAVVVAVLIVTALFMLTGIWHMYLKPLLHEIARS